ncbi:MAG TPA: SusD/RagB family nutrient-binding outer membrane lipoprotein [Longimicrobiales bacterium]
MRSNRLLNGLAVVALAGGLAACDQDLASINENPNEPSDVDAALILPQAIQSATDQVLGAGYWNLEGLGLWAQHYAKIQYTNEDRYDMRVSTIDALWSNMYSGPLKDVQTIIEKGEATGMPNHVAVGLVLKSWLFSVVTDLWGAVPYSEALQLSPEGGTTTPKYDPQDQIYAGLLADLERAAGMFDTASASFGSEDLLYGGDVEAWKRFANSMRLRLAMRISAADPALARQHAEAAIAGGVFQSNDDMAVLEYAGTPPNEHPLFENRVRNGRDDHAISKTMVDMLIALDDPRLQIYAEPSDSTGDYVGMPNGMNDGHPIVLKTISRIGDYWRRTPNAPAVIQSYAEVLFLQAEAALNGWAAGGTAAELYEAGIRASMEQYGIADSLITDYLMQPEVAFAADEATQREQIATQKWIALYGNGTEAFAEVRRTGFPVLTPGPSAENVNGGQIPFRMPYPGAEQTRNGSALAAAIAAQGGGNDYSTPMWWMP